MSDEITDKPAPRTERIGKYEILGHIATGGMGVVYKARDVDLDRLVALKILPPEMAKQTTTLERFRREAKAAAMLRHENIVTIFDVGEINGTHYIALEFIEGTDLQFYINRKCKIDPKETRQILIQAARALVHAHENGIVHRDIKPSNFLLMMVGDRILVKLTDFGLAIHHENDAEFRLTRDKTTVGTVDYMSPEQARDSRSADIRSDIYSLGCTAYHMLSGIAPFAKGTLPERIVQHMQIPPPDLKKLNKSVPAYLVSIINKMLEKKPEDRYQTPAALLTDLENPDRVIPIAKKKTPPPPKPEREKPRKSNGVPAAPVDDEPSDEPRQVKTSRKTRTEHADDWAESAAKEDNGAGKKSRKKSAQSSNVWVYATGGSVAVLVLILIAVLASNQRPTPKKEEKKVETPPVVHVPETKIETPIVDTAADKMTVPALVPPIMDTAPDKSDRVALRREYGGAFTSFPDAPPGAPTLRVSRLPAAGPASFRTLEEAVAETKPDTFTVIEIHDNGPLFVAAMPALAQRSIVIRGAPGFHPLLVWEMPKKTVAAKALPPFLSLARGKLILDNLDFVAQVSAAAPVVVFDLPESDFCVRSCTFSLAGKAPSGVALVRRIESANPQGRTRTWLQRTFVRGADVTLLDHQGAATEAMIEESLVAGQVQPLFRIKGREDDEFDLRCLRSTLVCGQVFLRWQAMTGNGGQPTVRGWMLDSIVSRDDTSGVGDLIQLADGADPSRMRWRAQNSVYAGWKQLLASGGKSIGGHDLDAWHRQWIYSDGDRAVVETWPANPPPVLEEQPADAFLPGLSPVAFTALTGPGTIGCVAGWLPAAPESWTERLYEPRNAPSIPLADLEPPRLETSEDGFYHGERLDLNKVDLGAHLNAVFQKKKPAPRIVLHLTGRGVCSTSPIRIKGVQQLVLYGDPSKDAKDPFVLEVNSVGVGQPLAAIEMIGGNLELIGIRVRLHALTLLPAIAHVQNGDLTLTRCQLQGPLFKPNETFQGVITISNAAAPNASLVLRDNVLMSGKVIVHMQDHVQLRARNNLLVSLGDAFVMEGNRSIGPATHVLDHNTFAVRQHALTLRTGPEFHAAGPVFLHAASNAFLAPFADSGEPRALLRGSEPWVSSGRWAWQGRYNVYDARLSAYLALTGAPTAGKQTMRDWQKTWGQTAEFEPYLFDVGAAVKTIAVDTPVAAGVLPTQLDRLTLPRTVRGDPEQEPPGADLWSLGVIRKKG